MKTICLAALLVVSFSSVSLGQANHRLEFYADEALSSCELAMNTPGLVKVHMVMTGPGIFRGISFKAPKPACMTNVIFVADVWHQQLAIVGNTQTGVDAVFICGPMPRYLGWIWYSVAGSVSTCCPYAPEPGSASGFIAFPGYLHAILVPACTEPDIYHTQSVLATTKGLVVNPNEMCRCDLPVATQPSTWGAVKALYR